MKIHRYLGMVGRRLAALLAVVLVAVLVPASPAAAHTVAQLPRDNLISNPWFSKVVNGELVLDTSGWVFVGSPTWGTGSDKADCPGPAPWGTAHTLRWARNSGQSPEFHPNLEVRAHTIVASSSGKRTIKFAMHWVMHRMTLKAVVYGGSSANGPWTQVWTPFQHTENVVWRPPAGSPKSAIWQHFTSLPGKFDNWYAPVPQTTTLGQGHAHYKVELRASYPNPDTTASGGVGGKLTGVYFGTQ